MGKRMSSRLSLTCGKRPAGIPDLAQTRIPTVTVDQMRAIDRVMVESLGITLVQMMENAGRALAEHARRMVGGDVRDRRVVVLAGPGGNGGGGLVAARRLFIWGARVSVMLAQPPDAMHGVPLQQLRILSQMGIPLEEPPRVGRSGLRDAEVVLDALVGYGLRGAPREPIASLIRAANQAGRSLLALDVPSGLDADSGDPAEPTIGATATLTLALPKAGLVRPSARDRVGELYLADISVPEAAYQQIGLSVGPIFSRSDIIRVPTDTASSGGPRRDGAH